MNEISELIFEILFEKVIRKRINPRLITNIKDGKIILLKDYVGDYYFVTNGDISTNETGKYLSSKTDDLVFARHTESMKPIALYSGRIKSVEGICTLKEFEDELQELYERISETEGHKDRNKELFSRYIKEAREIYDSLKAQDGEDAMMLAVRLGSDELSWSKRKTADMLLKADSEIAELWGNLRYNTDKRVAKTINRCIDSIIERCLNRL